MPARRGTAQRRPKSFRFPTLILPLDLYVCVCCSECCSEFLFSSNLPWMFVFAVYFILFVCFVNYPPAATASGDGSQAFHVPRTAYHRIIVDRPTHLGLRRTFYCTMIPSPRLPRGGWRPVAATCLAVATTCTVNDDALRINGEGSRGEGEGGGTKVGKIRVGLGVLGVVMAMLLGRVACRDRR